MKTQITTRSPMGAVAFETGGILVDGGWLRILGNGHERLTRTLPGWNEGRSEGFYLFADDAIGGFFALNGGAFGPDRGAVHYLAPDTLKWEPLGFGYSAFLQWVCTGNLDEFYEWIRWPDWNTEVQKLHGDRAYSFYPFLFSQEGKGGIGDRREVPVNDLWYLYQEVKKQLA